MTKTNIILFGGTFDPIHLGHYNIAKYAQNFLNAKKLFFIPTSINSFKQEWPTLPTHRIAMIEQLIIEDKDFEVSTCESEKSQISNTYETIIHFKKLYPNDKIYFLIGSDQLSRLHEWNQIDEIVANATFICYRRSSQEFNDVEQKNVQQWKVEVLQDLFYDVSATDIRNGFKWEHLHQKTIKYINDTNIYLHQRLKFHVDQNRYEHCVRTAELAKSLAEIHAPKIADEAYASGLMHDLAKQWNKEKLTNYLRYSSEFIAHRHGPYAAEFLKSFNHWDNQKTKAIYYHTIPSLMMSKLAKIVYISDHLEPGRKIQELDELRELSFKNLNQAYAKTLRWCTHHNKTEKGNKVTFKTRIIMFGHWLRGWK